MKTTEREALEFAAEHLSSDWPERCQEIVRLARAALAEARSGSGNQGAAFHDITAAWVSFSRRLEIAESVGMVVDERFNRIVKAVVSEVVNQRATEPPVPRASFSSALRGLVESLNRQPVAEELRFAAHELTVMADRISARARRGEEDEGGAS